MLAAALLFLFLPLAFAQSTTGSIEGFVQDQSGARIPAAEIAVFFDARSQRWSVESDANGAFQLAGLPPGAYRIEISKPGFARRTLRDVQVAADNATAVRETLAADIVSEQVTVVGAAPLLQTTRATQTATLTSSQLETLPTSSRHYTHLIVTEPGVSAPLADRTGGGMNLATEPGAQEEDGAQALNPSVNGQRPTSNSLTVNGVDATNMMSSHGTLGNNLNVPLDDVDIIEVQSALYSAVTGRNGGGNIQLITKSGGNRLHGSAYHFLQNEALNANEFFLNRSGTGRPRYRRNETGATVSGPLIRNRTFFFGSVRRTDFETGYATNARAATGIPTGLGDVRTRETIAAAANEWLRSGAEGDPRFAQNFMTALRAYPAEQVEALIGKFFVDPAALQFRTLTPQDIHPVSVNVLNVKRHGKLLLPSASSSMPLLPATASFGAERLKDETIPTIFYSWTGSGTVENHFGPKNRLRLNLIKSTQFIEEAFPWANSSPSPTLGDTSSYTASLADHHAFSPQWLNDLRGGFFELYNTRIAKFRDITNSALGIHNPLEEALGGLAAMAPTIDIATQVGGNNSSGIGSAWDFFDRQRVINLADTVSFVTSRHTLQFGGEIRRPTIKGEYMSRTNGDLDFTNWALFFTGHVSSSTSSDLDMGDTRRHFKMLDYSFFAHDDWKLRPGLTLNLGFRYDFYGFPTEVDGKIGNYYLPATAARLGVPAGFQVPANSIIFQPGFQPSQIGIVLEPGTTVDLSQIHPAKYDSTLVADRNNFAPRIGFAWQPTRSGRMVVRGGYGVFYDRLSGAFKFDLQRAAPFFIYQTLSAPVDFADPYPRLNVNPFQIPLNVQITRNAAGTPSWVRGDGTPFPRLSQFATKNNNFIDPFVRTPYVQQWAFNVQWEPMRGSLIDARYVGSRGVGLLAKVNLAQPRDPRLFPVNGLTSIYNNAGTVINPDFFVEPEFLGLNRNGGFQVRSNWGQSVYHALQLGFRRRHPRGVSWNLAYTYGRTLDNISTDRTTAEQDARNLAANRGPSNFDRTHRLTATYVAEIPMPFRRPLARRLLRGWQVSGLATLQSGSPFSALGNSGRNAQFAQPSVVRLDFAPGKTSDDARRSGRIQDRLPTFYDVSAFQDSLDHWGNAGRNILRGPRQAQFDFALAKTTSLRERTTAEFRWELFNIFNTPVFRNPASTFAAGGPGSAGVISRTLGGPRTMQVALRLRF